MIGVVAVTVAAPAQTPGFTANQRTEGERQVVAAGKLLADKLRDPASARFRNVFLFKTVGTDGKEHVSLCGEVNAQNGYGGMSGFETFTTVGDSLLIGSNSFLSADVVCGNGTPRVHDTRDYSPELRKAFNANAGQ